MYAQGLQHFTNIPLINLGLLIFFLTFVALLIRAFKKDANHQQAADLPLNDEEVVHE